MTFFTSNDSARHIWLHVTFEDASAQASLCLTGPEALRLAERLIEEHKLLRMNVTEQREVVTRD